MKKISFLLLILFMLIPSTVEASNGDACPTPYTEEMQKKIEEFQDKDANIIQAYIMELSEAIINMFEVNTIAQLVFGNPYCVWFEGGDYSDAGLEYGLYPAEIKSSIVDPGFGLFSNVFFSALTLAIMILGLRLSYSFMGTRKVHWQNEMAMYGIAGICMIGYIFGVEWLFAINHSIVQSVSQTLSNQGVNVSFGYISTSFIENAKTLNFSDILFFYAEWIILFFLNLVYLLRLFVITVMMIFGGAAIIALLFEWSRPFFKFWFIGFISTIFLQSIHALYFAMVLLFISLESVSFIFKFFLILLFLPMTTMLMSWFGMADGLLSSKVGQDTVNTIGKASRLMNMMKKRVPFNSKKNPVDVVSTSKISELAKGGPSWQKAGRAVVATNSVLAAAAGMSIGSGGAMLAGSLALKGTSAAIQAPRNIVAGAKGLKGAIDNVKQNNVSLDNIQSKRQHYGQVGESIGTMFGKGSLGRGIGYGFSGISRQRLLNSNELGGLNGASVESIVAQNPGAQIQFQQTNEGSGFYLKESEDMKLISPIGAADSSLKDGEIRSIDYQARTLLNPTNFSGNIDTQPLLNRTSGAYITDSNNQKFQDNNFNANSVNMHDYYQASHANGKNTISSDKWADLVGNSRMTGGER